MRKTILIIFGLVLIAGSVIQIAAAAEHHKGRKADGAPVSTNATPTGAAKIQSAWPAALTMQSDAITRTLSNAKLLRDKAWIQPPVRTRAIAALVSAFTNRQGSGDPCPLRDRHFPAIAVAKKSKRRAL